MKKQFLTLSLICSISLMGMESFVPEIPTKPTLKSVLVKKYVQKKPLTKQEQAYLSKTSKRAIAAGLAALGIAVVGSVVYKKYARPDAEQVFKKFGMNLKDQELDKALIFANTKDLQNLFRLQPNQKNEYDTFVTTYPKFKNALAEIRKVQISQLPN
ncbi:MAG TPA: hypothetical protein VI521_02115 [Candidatus Babeliales bacterium]|nr:hypothetical protein [Candidatus Babeliales bacterium]